VLKVDEDLAETCALAHDLGHTPFAHTGEDALKECMEPYGGFSHNDQTLRIVTKLEKKYPQFEGLNLTWESLEGLAKHNGPVTEKHKHDIALMELCKKADLELDSYASLEAQVAGIADDIAYNSHDLDDGFAAGFFTPDSLGAVPWVGEIVRRKKKEFPGIDQDLLAQETIRDVMGTYISDALAETRKRLADLEPQSPDDIRAAGKPTAAFSESMKKKDRALRDFLWANFYRHHRVNRVRFRAFGIVQDLFKTFMEHPRCLPGPWAKSAKETPKGWKAETWHARTVADYIASMTDRLAEQEHKEMFGA
jgi:dGTPase